MQLTVLNHPRVLHGFVQQQTERHYHESVCLIVTRKGESERRTRIHHSASDKCVEDAMVSDEVYASAPETETYDNEGESGGTED